MLESGVYRLELRSIPEQTVGIIRGRVRRSELEPFVAEAIDELFARLAHQRIQPASMPFAIRPQPNGRATIDVEVALPAIRRVASRGRMNGRVLPGCRALTTLHRGPHELIPAAYEAILRAMHEQGIEPADEPREVYVTNPAETSPEACETEVVWPVNVPAGWTPAPAR